MSTSDGARMPAKVYLGRLRSMDAEINRLQKKKEQAMLDAGSATSRMTATRTSGTTRRSRVEVCVVKALDMDEDITARIDALADAKREARRLIECIHNARYRQVLTLRYLGAYRWERICTRMDCCLRRAHSLHGEALLVFERVGKFYKRL